MPAKPHLNLVFIGHVDHGKSTTVGRILYDTGNIDPHELENLKKLAEQMGKATFEFAFVMDQVKEEDRKSTRLNSSHSQISYAVFCLKKKKKMKVRVSGGPIPAPQERVLQILILPWKGATESWTIFSTESALPQYGTSESQKGNVKWT